jgi:hypothetical protein
MVVHICTCSRGLFCSSAYRFSCCSRIFCCSSFSSFCSYFFYVAFPIVQDVSRVLLFEIVRKLSFILRFTAATVVFVLEGSPFLLFGFL